MISICEVEYSQIKLCDNGKNVGVKYMITIDCIENIYIAAEIYGIKIESSTEEGSISREVRGITANRNKIISLIEIVTKLKVLPCNIENAVDKILKK